MRSPDARLGQVELGREHVVPIVERRMPLPVPEPDDLDLVAVAGGHSDQTAVAAIEAAAAGLELDPLAELVAGLLQLGEPPASFLNQLVAHAASFPP
jgi:hypothetical protein